MYRHVVQYNKKNQIEWSLFQSINVFFKYKYLKNTRKTYIISPKNKSNYYSIIKENLTPDGYDPQSLLSVGVKYLSYNRFKNGKIDFEYIFNRITKSVTKKTILVNTNESKVWVLNYNGEKSMGLKVNPKKLK